MTTAEHSTRAPRTYGNWRRPLSPGLLGLGALGTTGLFVGLIVLIVTWFTLGLRFAAPVAAVLAIGLGLLSVRDRHGHTAAEQVGARLTWAGTARKGRAQYRSGPLSLVPWGTYQLPGVLAATRLSEWTDSWQRPFALLSVPATHHHSVVFATEPDGASLVDAEQVDAWVSHWGAWLGSLSAEPGLVAACVTVETAPDSGSRLRQEVTRQADPDAPAVAAAMLAEVVDRYPLGSAAIRAWVTLTFAASPRPGARRRSATIVARDLAARIPSLGQSLIATGAGAARPATAAELCELVRVAYDPAITHDMDAARSTGQVPDLRWGDVGPAATEASWSAYRHDSAVSVTWGMTSPPRGEVFSGVLHGLLGPHPDLARKRVTIVYRPLDPARAARVVEMDKRAADFRVTLGTRPSARALNEQRSAHTTAAEEARGAGLVDFALLLTATVTGPDRVADAVAAVDMLSAASRIQLRPMYGSQDTAFAACLPLGLVLPDHSSVPAVVRGSL